MCVSELKASDAAAKLFFVAHFYTEEAEAPA